MLIRGCIVIRAFLLQLVRLIRDSKENDSSTFCTRNLTLSEYIPDATRALTQLHAQTCSTDLIELFREIPPLLYVSQVSIDFIQQYGVTIYSTTFSDQQHRHSNVLHVPTTKRGDNLPNDKLLRLVNDQKFKIFLFTGLRKRSSSI